MSKLLEVKGLHADLQLPAGALHGVPFTVKDWIDAAGLPCVGAEARYKGRRPEEDATVVARMRQAWAILLGKTNTLVENPVVELSSMLMHFTRGWWTGIATRL